MNARIFLSALAVGLFSIAGASTTHGYDLLDTMLGSGSGCHGPKSKCCESPVQKNGGGKSDYGARQKCGAAQKDGKSSCGAAQKGCGAAQKGCGCKSRGGAAQKGPGCGSGCGRGCPLGLTRCGGYRQHACASDCGVWAGKGCGGSKGHGASQKGSGASQKEHASQKDYGVSQKDHDAAGHKAPQKANGADQKVNAQEPTPTPAYKHSVK